ncbi:hypothetical protein [Streptomyces sp. NPDC059165]|uniref:hypothetical protein n=1 Tax=Streptomyces sp. NPDC059165 TaxID=3346751 RepID=UPI0036888269
MAELTVSRATPAPSRRLVAAGVKRGTGPLIVEQSARRPATVDDIVRRLASTTYEWTAIAALGWGMGPAQLSITEAVTAAETAGFVTTTTRGGKTLVQLARRIRDVIEIGNARIFVYEEPGAHHPVAVDSYRLPTSDETDPDQTDPRDPRDLVLIDAVGGYSSTDIPSMIAEAVDYLHAEGIVSAEDVADRAAASHVRTRRAA